MANTKDLIGEQATLDALVAHALTTFEDSDVKKLRSYSFYYQDQMQEISLPNLSNNLEQEEFAYCSGLKRVKFATNITRVILSGTNSFRNIERSIIYVPDNLVEDYRNSYWWSDNALRIYGISTMPDPEWNEEEITDTWAQLIAKVNNGTANYNIGNYKDLDCGTEGTVRCYVIGKNVDELASGSGTATLTFATNVTLQTTHRMNPANSGNTEGTGAIGGWGKCEMRTYLSDTILPLLPVEVQTAIESVKKYSGIYNTSEQLVKDDVTSDKLWLFSYKEVGFGTEYETLGPVYGLCFAVRIRKNQSDHPSYWFMRSARNTSNFHCVANDGSKTVTSAGDAYGVIFGFSI